MPNEINSETGLKINAASGIDTTSIVDYEDICWVSALPYPSKRSAVILSIWPCMNSAAHNFKVHT
jgi:hypothetical protein